MLSAAILAAALASSPAPLPGLALGECHAARQGQTVTATVTLTNSTDRAARGVIHTRYVTTRPAAKYLGFKDAIIYTLYAGETRVIQTRLALPEGAKGRVECVSIFAYGWEWTTPR